MVRSHLVRVAILAQIVFTCVFAFGGFQTRSSVGSLTVGGRSIEVRDGRLVASDIIDNHHRWDVSAPYIMTSWDNRLVARDPKGEALELTFTKQKGSAAEWTFEILETFKPRTVGRDGFQEGEVGQRFRARVPDGPFRGWYAGLGPAEELRNYKKSFLRPLILVKDVDHAAEFRFVRTKYEVGHK